MSRVDVSGRVNKVIEYGRLGFVDSSEVKVFFERVSGEWDQMRSSFYNADLIDALADRAHIGAGTTVVDVGTGTGFVVAGIAGRAARAVGVDSSPAMLAVARHNMAALGVDNVAVVEADLDALPLPNESVHAAVANMVLHRAPRPATMVTEMARVVRPGGKVAITDEIEHNYEWMRTEQADIWLGFSPDQIDGFFRQAGLIQYGYASLGMQ